MQPTNAKMTAVDKRKEREMKKHQAMVDELSEEQRSEFLQLFSRFVAGDKLDPSKPATTEQLESFKDREIQEKDIERMCKAHGYGHKATDPIKKDEIKKMMEEVDEDGGGSIGFDEFLILMVKHLNENELADEVIKAFQVLNVVIKNDDEDDEARNKISAASLKYYMTNYGEKLTDEEVDELFNEADITYDKDINIDEFVRSTLLK